MRAMASWSQGEAEGCFCMGCIVAALVGSPGWSKPVERLVGLYALGLCLRVAAFGQQPLQRGTAQITVGGVEGTDGQLVQCTPGVHLCVHKKNVCGLRDLRRLQRKHRGERMFATFAP